MKYLLILLCTSCTLSYQTAQKKPFTVEGIKVYNHYTQVSKEEFKHVIDIFNAQYPDSKGMFKGISCHFERIQVECGDNKRNFWGCYHDGEKKINVYVDKSCLGLTSLLHELTHAYLHLTFGDPDRNHRYPYYWDTGLYRLRSAAHCLIREKNVENKYEVD